MLLGCKDSPVIIWRKAVVTLNDTVGQGRNKVPGAPTFWGSGNLGGQSALHLRNHSALQIDSVSHESFCIRVLLVEISHKFRILRVAHPMIGVVPRSSMRRDLEGNFLGQGRGLLWKCKGGPFAARREGCKIRKLWREWGSWISNRAVPAEKKKEIARRHWNRNKKSSGGRPAHMEGGRLLTHNSVTDRGLISNGPCTYEDFKIHHVLLISVKINPYFLAKPSKSATEQVRTEWNFRERVRLRWDEYIYASRMWSTYYRSLVWSTSWLVKWFALRRDVWLFHLRVC